jgi:hypothetical protein
MTQEITQEERLDLTDKKIRAEKLAYTIELFKNLEKVTKGSAIIDAKSLYAENQRLKEQLDREIHINRKMKRVLEVYATGKFDPNRFEEGDYAYATDIRALDNGDLAKETLKQIEEME